MLFENMMDKSSGNRKSLYWNESLETRTPTTKSRTSFSYSTSIQTPTKCPEELTTNTELDVSFESSEEDPTPVKLQPARAGLRVKSFDFPESRGWNVLDLEVLKAFKESINANSKPSSSLEALKAYKIQSATHFRDRFIKSLLEKKARQEGLSPNFKTGTGNNLLISNNFGLG